MFLEFQELLPICRLSAKCGHTAWALTRISVNLQFTVADLACKLSVQRKAFTGHLNCRGKEVSLLSCLYLMMECAFGIWKDCVCVSKKKRKKEKREKKEEKKQPSWAGRYMRVLVNKSLQLCKSKGNSFAGAGSQSLSNFQNELSSLQDFLSQ